MREILDAFEEWYVGEGYSPDNLIKASDGTESEVIFVLPNVQTHWKAWQMATTKANAQIEALTADADHQRDRRNAARECVDKLSDIARQHGCDSVKDMGGKLAQLEAENQTLKKQVEQLDRDVGATIDARDRCEEHADRLAYGIAKALAIDIGEHSSMNCPWNNAYFAIDDFSVNDQSAAGVTQFKEWALTTAGLAPASVQLSCGAAIHAIWLSHLNHYVEGLKQQAQNPST